MAQSFLSPPYTLAMVVAMTMPVVAWMRIRKHTWRLSAEMAEAMLVPTVLLIAVCWVAHLPSTVLITGTHILMVPAILGVMLYRWSDYTCEPGSRKSLARGEPARTMIQEAGERLTYTQTTLETLADAAVRLLDAEVTWPPIPTNWVQRAAELITRHMPHDHREGVKDVPVASSIICRDSSHTPGDRRWKDV